MKREGGRRLLVVTVIVLALWTAAFVSGATGRFTPERLRAVLAGQGLWGAAAFVAVFSVGQLLRVPSFAFVAAAAAVYGKTGGIPVALLGALVSATVSFAVVRAFAGAALADVKHPVIRRLLAKVDTRPVLTVALLRLLFQTAPPLNYALPMTALRWRDHLLGSALGLPVPVSAMVFFFDWLFHGGQ